MSNPTPNQSSEINIGSIVALDTHPFFNEDDSESIFISGDADTLSPLMVVIETLRETKQVFEENSGMQLTRPGSLQCKCIWYSHRSSHFEEAWISSRILKLINKTSQFIENNKLQYGAHVVLKTAQIEISKKKVSLKQFGTLTPEKNKSITGLLSFASPVMQVIGTTRSESKEPLFDPKTGDKKRFISRQLIKCKFYNTVSDKLSEVLLPIEALTEVQVISKSDLEALYKVISNGRALRAISDNNKYALTIIKPHCIIYKLGSYYLEGLDYLENKMVEVLIKDYKNEFEEVDKYVEHLPKFENNGDQLIITPIKKNTIVGLSFDKLWRIKYKDAYDNLTTRTIYNIEFFYSNEKDESGKDKRIDYLKATCILRNQRERYFRIDRIQQIEVLDLEISEAIKEDSIVNVINAGE